MKKLFSILILGTITTQSFGATVKLAKLDSSKKNILIDVVYSGGCGKHDFTLKLEGCAESFPVQCSAQLIEKTDDFCEALISSTVVISLEEYKLNDSYYERASLKITGDKDETGKSSSATVRLP